MKLPPPSAGDSYVVLEAVSPTFSSPDRLPPVPAMMLRQGVTREISVPDSRYSHFTSSSTSPLRGIDSKFSLSPDIGTWGTDVLDDYDDELHRPDDRDRKGIQHDGKFISWRGAINLGCLVFVCVGVVTLLYRTSEILV
ncbi:hypothetical protein BDM02DRAFT_2499413 [Thelephora ganbajun]|uniref:Uncharacterized protein n=1 Tax=Thelephora ganbajun TaxID=370292 RepID=A0ACB6ZE21_THEGA|nr:hypothetical protein BDM02DRAFT_2499413 [Thelephora ganbajun]